MTVSDTGTDTSTDTSTDTGATLGAVEVCRLEELPVEEATSVEMPGHGRIAVFHTEDGVFALQDRCSHQEANLSDGFAEGCYVECPLHESRFDLRTGAPDQPPATRPVTPYRAWCDDAGMIRVAAFGPEAEQ